LAGPSGCPLVGAQAGPSGCPLVGAQAPGNAAAADAVADGGRVPSGKLMVGGWAGGGPWPAKRTAPSTALGGKPGGALACGCGEE
jgi:hypothetical protein